MNFRSINPRRRDPSFRNGRNAWHHCPTRESRFEPPRPLWETGDVEYNVSKAEKQIVLIAEISGNPIGVCIALAGRTEIAPVFIQLVAVVPQARHRGAGLALVRAVARAEPRRDIVMAIQDENAAAKALSERVAVALDSRIRRFPVRSYRRSEMGIAGG